MLRHHHPPRRGPLAFGLAALALTGAAAGHAEAVCTATACDAASLPASCCTASTCTIDGTLTVIQPTCTFDFDGKNLTVSGTVAAQGKTITLKARTVKVTGLIDVRGPGGADAGKVTIVTTQPADPSVLAYSQEGGTSAIIDASSSASKGGTISIQATGKVSLSKGSVKADGGPAAAGGVVDVLTTAGDVSVQISVSASGAVPPPIGQRGADITITTPHDLSVAGSGRLTADLGSLGLSIGGAAVFADGSVLQTNLGGDISVVAASIDGRGEFRAGNGDFGSVDLTAEAGPLFLLRATDGIKVGPGGGVSLTTESPVPDGTLTSGMPILATGASVELTSAGSVLVSKKITTTGVTIETDPTGGGEISIAADGDVEVSTAIVGSDTSSVEDVTIEALGNVTIGGNIDLKGGLEADGGNLEITAGGTLTVQNDIFFNVSGADLSSGGSIDLEAGGDLTVAAPVEFIADGSPVGGAGSIIVRAGIDEFSVPRLPGNVLFQGDIKANGHSTIASSIVIEGCTVTIPSGAVIDVTGDLGSKNVVTARKSLVIGGTLKATDANELAFPSGMMPSLTGSLTPAPSAGTCAAGMQGPNGCELPVCTGTNTPAGCLNACPTCGDSVVEFPETCEVNEPVCNGDVFCNALCRARSCTDNNPCTVNACDPVQGCTIALEPNGTDCGNGTVCDGLEACLNGACLVQPGTVPACGSDQNPCTLDGCNPVTGCFHTPDPGPGRPGCDDADTCNGAETCSAQGACQPGTPVVCPPGQFCDPANGQCMSFGGCDTPADCDDLNPCTDNLCEGNVCSNPPKQNGTSCDDDDVCNGVRTCQGGACQPASPLVCDDGNPCTTDTCDPQLGCQTTSDPACCTADGDCDDGKACTTDSCVGNACAHATISCVDGDACTSDLPCDEGTSCSNSNPPIPDCTPCTTPADCPAPTDVCDDKACIDGRCQPAPSANCCDGDADCTDIDSNVCTDNGPCNVGTHRCDGPFPLTGTLCGTTCEPATCQSGVCVQGTPLDCGDGDICTADVCVDPAGCTNPAIPLCCLAANECDDGNVCTADGCDLAANRCDNVAEPECTSCTGNDPFECGPRCSNACVAGRCAEVTANCDDGDPCTTDACDATTGCTHGPATGPGCGECSGAADCTDSDGCTDDACNDANRCTHADKIAFAAVTCRLDEMQATFGAATPGGSNNRKTLAKLGKKLSKLATKVRAAEANPNCKKAKRGLKAAARQLRGFQRTVNRAAGKKLDAGLATAVATRAGEAAMQTDLVLSGLGC